MSEAEEIFETRNHMGHRKKGSGEMRKVYVATGVILSLLAVRSAPAQLSLNRVSANIGIIRTLFPDGTPGKGHQYAVYPELQIGGRFFLPAVRWTAYWGYWTDGVEQVVPVADAVTYSSTSHIVGVRIALLPAEMLPHWPLPVGVFTGVGYHFIARKYIGGTGVDGRPGRNITGHATTVDLGVNVEFQIFGPVGIRGEIQQFIPPGSGDFDRSQINRRAFKVGISFAL